MAQIQEIILLNQSNKSDEFLKSIGKNTTLFIVIGNILVIASTFLIVAVIMIQIKNSN